MNYLTLLEVADLLVELLDTDSVTAGCIDATKTRTIGVYQREGFVPRECIGTVSSWQTAKIRVLVHWSDSPSEAERMSLEIAGLFDSFDNMETQNHIIKFAEVKAVRNIGKDEKGICEYIADVDFIYTERKI